MMASLDAASSSNTENKQGAAASASVQQAAAEVSQREQELKDLRTEVKAAQAALLKAAENKASKQIIKIHEAIVKRADEAVKFARNQLVHEQQQQGSAPAGGMCL
jgi:hypothetical protein